MDEEACGEQTLHARQAVDALCILYVSAGQVWHCVEGAGLNVPYVHSSQVRRVGEK